MADTATDLNTTALTRIHEDLGARMVPFAGYAMPVQYPLGVLGEHNWTREHAGLFDVSHMGQGFLIGPDHETTARALEALVPADILNLKPGQQRYSMLLDEKGGIIDDLMVSRLGPSMDGTLYLVVNAGNKETDWAHIAARLPENVRVERLDDWALIALQGPQAEAVFARFCPGVADLGFMMRGVFDFQGVTVYVSRSGYTGEDGYEFAVENKHAAAVWNALLAEPEVEAIGLGARDSLRLEAGLCLHGHDIDVTTTPVEADLKWTIQKRRREEGGFPGAERVLAEIANGPKRLRVGIRPEGRAPAREGTEITDPAGNPVGRVTSGGFGPTVGGPVAMGYVAAEHSKPGTPVNLIVRGEPRPATVVAMPFAPHRYKR